MNKIKVVIPEDYKPEAKDCPVCGKAFSDLRDIVNFRKWQCCHNCDDKYRYPNREKWENGWRPDNYIEKEIHNVRHS